MMNYRDFNKKVEESILAFMPEEYRGAEVGVTEVPKVNKTKDAIIIKARGSRAGLVIYLDELYADYCKTGNLYKTLARASESLIESEAAAASKAGIEIDAGISKEKTVFQLINTAQNKAMLENVPHREFLDLSVVYRIVLDAGKEGIMSGLITNRLAGELEATEDELFSLAVENTRKIFPPKLMSINEMIKGLIGEIGGEPGMEIMPDEGTGMWVITNEQSFNGAGTVIYEELLFSLAEKVGSDLYIMPASIHEMIAVSASGITPKELAFMVTEINMTQVELEERLSNQVYFYSRTSRQMSLATDTQKSLYTRKADQQ